MQGTDLPQLDFKQQPWQRSFVQCHVITKVACRFVGQSWESQFFSSLARPSFENGSRLKADGLFNSEFPNVWNGVGLMLLFYVSSCISFNKSMMLAVISIEIIFQCSCFFKSRRYSIFFYLRHTLFIRARLVSVITISTFIFCFNLFIICKFFKSALSWYLFHG